LITCYHSDHAASDEQSNRLTGRIALPAHTPHDLRVRLRRFRLPPAAADPHIAPPVPPPMPAHPHGAGTGPNDIAATNPYPAAVPGVIARRPDISGTRSVRNDLDRGRRRG